MKNPSPHGSRSHQLAAEMWLVLVVLIWAANYPLSKYALGRMDPFIFNAIRYCTAALVARSIMLFRDSSVPVAPADRSRFLRAGVVASIFYQILFVAGLARATAGNAAVILSTSPLWTVYIQARLHRDRIPTAMFSGMILSLAGVLLIIVGGGTKFGFASSEFAGDLILFGAALLWGLNSNLQKPLLTTYSPLQLSWIFFLIGAVGLTAIAIPVLVSSGLGGAGWGEGGAAVLSGAFSIGIGNLYWSHGVKVLGPGKTANFNNLVPVVAIGLSYLTLHETLTALQLIGTSVTVIGVWIARR
ncbi:MAG TPA: DMT family transporter [Bacteroidota bacterium]|nr:DMT family transporter [Bacteroidota bacterium]